MQVKQVSRDSNPRYLYAQQTILDKMFYSKKWDMSILFSSEEMEKLQEDLRKGFSNLD